MTVSYKSDFTPRHNTIYLIISHLSNWYYKKYPENVWKIILSVKLGLNAPAYRKYLCEKFVKAGEGVYKNKYSGNYQIDWLDGPSIDYLSDIPSFSIVPDKEGEGYLVIPEGVATYEGYYVNVGKRNGHYYIMQYGTTDPDIEPSDDIEPVTIEE